MSASWALMSAHSPRQSLSWTWALRMVTWPTSHFMPPASYVAAGVQGVVAGELGPVVGGGVVIKAVERYADNVPVVAADAHLLVVVVMAAEDLHAVDCIVTPKYMFFWTVRLRGPSQWHGCRV